MKKNARTVRGPDGHEWPATVVEVQESTERWSEATLADGTVIRFKPIVLEASRIDGQHDDDGNPVYNIKHQVVITIASAPDKLKAKVQ